MFLHGPPAFVRLLVFVITSVVLMTVDHRAHDLESVRSVLSTIIYPVQYAVDIPARMGRWADENLASREALIEENGRLRHQQLLMQARLEKFAELEAENKRLRRLLDSSVKVKERVLVADLLAVDPDPFSRRIVIDKGTREGAFDGQSVIDANGILGQIIHVSPFTSTALLITDPSHAVPVQAVRTGIRSIAVGTGSADVLELLHIPNNADVRVGDLLVTSGLGGRFPPGYPVGHVISVERDSSEPFAHILVKPSAKLERNREVLLVWPPKSEAGTAAEELKSNGS